MVILQAVMGEHSVSIAENREVRARFIRHLLHDIRALEEMLDRNMIESGITRVGAEQEFCLVDHNWRPSINSAEILQALDDPHYQTELARYNLEINLDPRKVESGCFGAINEELTRRLNNANEEAINLNTRILLAGILPTISKNELEFEYMTPMPRYFALNEAVKRHRKGDFSVHLDGVDELSLLHDSVLFEACNTSFQVHLQVSPDDFVASYNWAQAIAAPILGIATNSPLLLGRELWAETRIALFQQSIDTRLSSYALKEQEPRVTFGDRWETGSLAEIFKNDIARHRVILSKEIREDSLETLKSGKVPGLKALCVHNGTVYRWNRPCYGVSKGTAHVRIENRYLPSGPTPIDEMANFVLWVGLMLGRPAGFDNIAEVMDFRDAKSNFFRAARNGKDSVLTWDGKSRHLTDLLRNDLLPMAREGLLNYGLEEKEISEYLDVIEGRIDGQTGSQWMISGFRQARATMKKDDALMVLTKSIHDNQRKGRPVHEWPPMHQDLEPHEAASRVEHIMSTQLFTVMDKDLAMLATSVMRWKNIHHVPVETVERDLCGLLTWTHMIRNHKHEEDPALLVEDIMEKNVISVVPTTPIREAIRIMKENEIGCLPVAVENELVGIITIEDVLEFDHEEKQPGNPG